MKKLLGRALIYRAGSLILGFTVLLLLTGDARQSVLWESIFFFTHTIYYMVFHTIEYKLRTAQGWEELIESSGRGVEVEVRGDSSSRRFVSDKPINHG